VAVDQRRDGSDGAADMVVDRALLAGHYQLAARAELEPNADLREGRQDRLDTPDVGRAPAY
jgi:hypothetical protein